MAVPTSTKNTTSIVNGLLKTSKKKTANRHSITFIISAFLIVALVAHSIWWTQYDATTHPQTQEIKALLMKNNDDNKENIIIKNAEKLSNEDTSKFIRIKEQNVHESSKNNEGFKMVFFIGLEGVGHHLVTELLKESPHVQTLKTDLGIVPSHLGNAQHLLYYHQHDIGALWGSFCSSSNPKPTSDRQYTNLVAEFSKIKSLSKNYHVTLPLNCIKGGGGFGMESYPNFKTACRELTWPNLDILYSACQKSKLDCQQVYVFRDPASVMASTIRREFNPTILQGIHLYITHLYVIHAQLSRYHNKTISCHDFYDPSLSHEVLWGPFRDLFGWDNKTDTFNKYIDSKYKPPTPMTQEGRQALLPSGYDMFMKSYYNIHNRVVNLCRHDQKVNSLVNNNHQLPTNMILPIQDDIRQHVNSSPIKIVLTIGLHGAGHDILSSLFQKYDTQLDRLVQPLQQASYNDKQYEEGLLSMHCSKVKDVDIDGKYQNVVTAMKDISMKRIEGGTIPLTFMSYPNHLLPPSECQQADYVNMDVFYSACNDAGVDCEHVFVYRDPYSLLHEVSNLLGSKTNQHVRKRQRRYRRRLLLDHYSGMNFSGGGDDNGDDNNMFLSTDNKSNNTIDYNRRDGRHRRLKNRKRRRPSGNVQNVQSRSSFASTGAGQSKKKSPSKPRAKLPKSFSLLYYIHLYTSMMYMIHSHFVTHPHRTGGCLDMNKNENDKSKMWMSIKSIYGLVMKSDKEDDKALVYLDDLMKSKTSRPLTDAEQSLLIPDEFKVYMDSIMLAHEKAIDLCESSLLLSKPEQ